MEVDQLELLVELGLDRDAVVVATCACRFPELVVVVLHRDQRRGDRDHSRQKVFCTCFEKVKVITLCKKLFHREGFKTGPLIFSTERENDLQPTNAIALVLSIKDGLWLAVSCFSFRF